MNEIKDRVPTSMPQRAPFNQLSYKINHSYCQEMSSLSFDLDFNQ